MHRSCNTVEAKAKLNELLDDVASGQEIVICRRGKAVAKLIPATDEGLDDRDHTRRLLERLRRFHRRVRANRGTKGHTVALLRELRKES